MGWYGSWNSSVGRPRAGAGMSASSGAARANRCLRSRGRRRRLDVLRGTRYGIGARGAGDLLRFRILLERRRLLLSFRRQRHLVLVDLRDAIALQVDLDLVRQADGAG